MNFPIVDGFDNSYNGGGSDCFVAKISPDGKQLLLIYRDLPLKYLDIEKGSVVREIPIKADPKKVYDYAFSPDMKLLALATNTGIKLWDLKKEKELKMKGSVL